MNKGEASREIIRYENPKRDMGRSRSLQFSFVGAGHHHSIIGYILDT